MIIDNDITAGSLGSADPRC